MIKANLHSHSEFCDGKAPMEEMVKSAIAKGFSILGISSHAPVAIENKFAISDEEQLQKYCDEVQRLRKKYISHIEIHLSLEIDYIPGITKDFSDFSNPYGLDYTIGSVHLVHNEQPGRLWFIDGPDAGIYDRGLQDNFGGDIRKAVTSYYRQINEMITTQKPDMIGHIDKIKMHNKGRYFSEDESWYKQLVEETLEYVKANNCILEVNTRGIYKGRSESLFPGVAVLKEALKKRIPISLNSDAHKPEDMDGYYPEAMRTIQEIGFKEMYYFTKKEWKAFSF